jgi:DNA mismatch endonuclease (patch repair protein)
MSAIKNRNTKPGLYFRKAMFQRGYRYRVNSRKVFGHPDLYLAKYKAAIFIHGCLWHRHSNCKYAYVPGTNTEFWMRKFESNRKRDQEVLSVLQNQNIRCLIIWECSIKLMQKSSEEKERTLESVEKFLHTQTVHLEI